MKQGNDIDTNIKIKQGSQLSAYIHDLSNVNFWKNFFFSNFFQLLPVWAMFIIQMVSEYSFNIEDYISNFLVFVIIACVVDLADFFTKKETKANEMSALLILFMLLLILCVSLIIYCLQLLYSVTNLKISMLWICALTIIFFVIVLYINLWQVYINQGVEVK